VAAIPPEELFTLAPDHPDVAGSVLVEMLDGFIDAGAARRLAREALLGAGEARPVASFDVDLLHDYRARRPSMLFEQDHWESYEAPVLDIVQVLDSAGTPYLLMHGSEPDVMWDRFATAVILLVEQLDVRLTIGTNAIPMAVPHTRPVGVTAHASRPELISGYQPWVATVQVPGSAGHLIEHRLAVAGHDSMGFAVHVPHYLAQAAFPPAAEALIGAISRGSGLALPVGNLPEASGEAQESIAALLAQSDELVELVRTLETQYDAVVASRADALDASGTVAGQPLPTAEELGAELERYLAEQTKRRPDDPR
jgi:PAC2 family protein